MIKKTSLCDVEYANCVKFDLIYHSKMLCLLLYAIQCATSEMRCISKWTLDNSVKILIILHPSKSVHIFKCCCWNPCYSILFHSTENILK